MANLYDVAILGANAAGWAAGYALATAGAEVVVVDAPGPSIECPLAEWVPKPLFGLSGMPKGLVKAVKPAPFSQVTYHDRDFAQQTVQKSRGPAGYLVQSADLILGLKRLAEKAGAKGRTTRTPPAVQLDEDHIRLVGTTPVNAKFLIFCQSRPHEVLAELGLPVRAIPRSSCLAAGIDLPSATKLPADLAGLHVIQCREPSELGLCFAVGKTAHVRVVSMSSAAGTRGEELSALVAGLTRAKLLPANVLAKAKGAVWSPPAGVALELESHVAKRCILAGSAGGFVDTLTGHTLYPTVHSALLAAEIVGKALASKAPQDTLMAYKNRWQEELADYLRPPSTAIQLLLPLLFANQRLVARFTKALLYGQSV